MTCLVGLFLRNEGTWDSANPREFGNSACLTCKVLYVIYGDSVTALSTHSCDLLTTSCVPAVRLGREPKEKKYAGPASRNSRVMTESDVTRK